MKITTKLLASLSNNDPELKEVEIDGDFDTADEIKELAIQKFSAAIKSNTKVQALWFDEYSMSDNAINYLTDALVENTALQYISLDDCDLNDTRAEKIADAVKLNMTLVGLSLENNDFGDAALVHFADMLKINTPLKTLVLGSMGGDLTSQGVRVLMVGLQSNNTLRHLNLGHNSSVKTEGARYIADALKMGCRLLELNLDWTDLNSEGAILIADALKANPALQSLSLLGNTIGINGIDAIADSLKINTNLRIINLWNNDIYDVGAIRFADVLKTNKTLKNMVLGISEIGDEGACAFAEALKENNTLKELDLRLSKFGVVGMSALTDALSDNYSLCKLEIQSERVSASENPLKSELLAQYLERNKKFSPFHDLIQLQLTDQLSLEEIKKLRVDLEAIAPELDKDNPIPNTDEGLLLYTLNKSSVAFEKTFPALFDEKNPLMSTDYLAENYRLLCALCYSEAGAEKDALPLLLQPFYHPDLQRMADKKTGTLLLITDAFDNASLQEKTARYQLMAHCSQDDVNSTVFKFAMSGIKNPENPVSVSDLYDSNLKQGGHEPFKLNESIQETKDSVLNVINQASIKLPENIDLTTPEPLNNTNEIITSQITNDLLDKSRANDPELTDSFKKFKTEYKELDSELKAKLAVEELLTPTSKPHNKNT